MNGPDLSHLLDGDDSERPSPAVLEGIVRRHRRLRARRARTAATLGLVLVVAGAGVGIGLSHQGATSSASGRSNSGPTVPRGSTLGPTSKYPPSPVGVVPTGLGWINTDSGVGPNAESLSSLNATSTLQQAGRLQATYFAPTSSKAASATCGVVGCPTLSPTELGIGDLPIHHLFTRTSDGITVRVFTAMWAVAPLELVPTGSSAGSSGAGSAGRCGARSLRHARRAAC